MLYGSPLSLLRRDDGTATLQIHLREARQMFLTVDPAPFHDKALDAAAERYLVDACRQAGKHRLSGIVIQLPHGEVDSADARVLPAAIHGHFEHRQHQLGDSLRQLLHDGAMSLGIGLSFFLGCLLLRQAMVRWPPAFDHTLVDEALLIFGWVALWRPMEVLLYDWWPVLRERDFMRLLVTLPIEISRHSGEPGVDVTSEATPEPRSEAGGGAASPAAAPFDVQPMQA